MRAAASHPFPTPACWVVLGGGPLVVLGGGWRERCWVVLGGCWLTWRGGIWSETRETHTAHLEVTLQVCLPLGRHDPGAVASKEAVGRVMRSET